MDLSKLPKLSNTTDHIPSSTEPDSVDSTIGPVATPTMRLPVGGLADAWISLGVGVFLLLWQPRFLQWVSSRIFHTAFNEFLDANGAVVPYPHMPEFWSDLGPTLFGLVLILDGVLLFTRQRALVWVAFGLTLLTTAFNLYWAIASYSEYGLAPISFLAVIFGGYIALSQWRLLKLGKRAQV